MSEVLFYRFKFIKQLNAWAQQVQTDISNDKEQLKLDTKQSLKSRMN